jgi:hypothetical protein
MKTITILLLSFFAVINCHGQLIKRIGQRAKENAEWKLQQKVNQKVDQGLDSLTAPRKKKNTKETEPFQPAQQKENTTGDNSKNNSAKPITGKTVPEDEEMGTKEGFVTLKLSADKIFMGGSVLISGESILYKNFKQVEIKVTGPSPTDTRNISLSTGGKFNAVWNALDKTGEYTVTVTSSDKKARESATFSVEEIDIIFADDWPEENTKATKDAYDKLEKAADLAEAGLGPKDKAELDKKMEAIKEKVDAVLKLFKSLNTAGKEIAKQAKSGKKMPPNLADNLSALNDNLAEQARQMKTLERATDRQPQDNTVCEHLVMVSEVCAAFSTFTNLWATSVKGIIKNIVLDKGVPKVVETINKGRVRSEAEFGAKESSKLFATALTDAESLGAKLGIAGFTGDVVQFASDVMLKKYCGVYKGELKHDYTVIFRNGNGETWWKYGVEVQATFTLRYPRDKNSGKVIRMKGNIEGNGTKFTFFQNIQVEDEFKKGTKENIEVVPLKVITPVAVPVATSQNDALGFGAVARGAFTPAYFNLPVDAEYNTDDDKIKIFLNSPIIDFSPAVTNQFIFLLVGGDLLPYFKRMNFPIHKIFRTLGSVMAKNNEFPVDKDSKGNPSFTGKVNKHLGSKADKIEHDLNYTVTAKKD